MNYILQNDEMRCVSGEEPIIDFNQKFIKNLDEILDIAKKVQKDNNYNFDSSIDYLINNAGDDAESILGIRNLEDLNENLLLGIAENKNILAIMSIINGLYNASLYKLKINEHSLYEER